jgi:UDP-3-O-[3-hydroxymyristoyl] glucosamine N-acyltransferase
MNKKKYSLDELLPFIPQKHKISGVIDSAKVYFSKVSPLSDADHTCFTFIDEKRPDKQTLFDNCNAGFVICDFEINIKAKDSQVIIQVDSPKVVFSIIVNALFVSHPDWGVHPTAFIHPEAEIHEQTYIGSFSHIGKCAIGSGSIIYGNCYLYDRVKVGKNVIIHAGAVLGADGFGYNRDDTGKPIQFPHIGEIEIEDYVEIGANSTIDQGSLGSTRIKYATKIDNLVHIGHNVEIGKCCYVAAHASIAGSTVIGDYSEVWMGVNVADGVKVGHRSTVGIGSVLIQDIENNKKVFGNPARIISSDN